MHRPLLDFTVSYWLLKVSDRARTLAQFFVLILTLRTHFIHIPYTCGSEIKSVVYLLRNKSILRRKLFFILAKIFNIKMFYPWNFSANSMAESATCYLISSIFNSCLPTLILFRYHYSNRYEQVKALFKLYSKRLRVWLQTTFCHCIWPIKLSIRVIRILRYALNPTHGSLKYKAAVFH